MLVNDFVKQLFDLFINSDTLNVNTVNAYFIFIDIISFVITGLMACIIAMLPFMVYRSIKKWLR